ncbi:MAG: hypothetical protein QI197_08605 [Candidatus Korarchaeota archaeon]|nr:hypothetical protein [Candidatus Korarchaeota archaeon]
MERWKTASIPHRLLSSILYQLAPLAVLEYGGGPEHLSLSFFLMYLGLMVGNLTWTRALAPKERHVPGIALGHLSLVVPGLVVSYPDVYAALLASFLVAFLSPISYFSGLFYAYDQLKDPSEASSSYESVSGWAWLSGLFLGAFILHSMNIEGLALLSVLIDLLLIPLIVASLRIPVLSILRKAYEEEIGLLPIIEEGIEAVHRAEEEALEWTMALMSRVARGTLFQKPAYILLSLPKVGVPFSLKVFLAFMGLGLAYPQLVGVQKALGLNNSHIYLLSALSSLVSSTLYKRAGRGDEVRNLNLSLLARSAMLFSVPTVLLGIFSPFEYFIAFMILDGATWSFIMVSISRRGLRVSLEYLGQVNFVRSLGWSIGALLGGFVTSYAGLVILYEVSAVLVMLASVIKTKKLEHEVRRSLLIQK